VPLANCEHAEEVRYGTEFGLNLVEQFFGLAHGVGRVELSDAVHLGEFPLSFVLLGF
jgi:hypothetical protein